MISLDRREMLLAATAGGLAAVTDPMFAQESSASPGWKYMVASCMYGCEPLEVILPELPKLDCDLIDLWPRVHGCQREEIDQLGENAFKELVDRHGIKVACLSQYKLGLFGLDEEIRLASRLDIPRIVVHAGGKPIKDADVARGEVDRLLAKATTVFEHAENHGVTISIENHSGTLLGTQPAIDHFLENLDHSNAGFALAPAHLPQDGELIAGLVRKCGSKLDLFYAWQYGRGFREKMPRADEWLQLPGRGSLDFTPIMRALCDINFQGVVEVMMHPTPRGIPIAEDIASVTELIQTSHNYLKQKTPCPS
ncbi:MAG: sugar phosphate isomerase/epimerase [Planctomycetota bacterium]